MSGFDDLPFFATDAELAIALLGRKRASQWRDLAPLYESKGLPKIDSLTGGRCTPAVKRFFEEQNGVGLHPLRAPDGQEGEPESWNVRKPRSPRRA